MKRNSILGLATAGLVAIAASQAVVTLGTASAQDTPPADTQPPATGTEDLGGAEDLTAPTGVSAPKEVTLTTSEQTGRANEYLATMKNVRNQVRRALQEAREQRDVVKTLCLDDKLNQLDVAIRSAQDRQKALELAAARKDTDLASHEFTILSVLNQRVTQLNSEAAQCIGKEVGIVGESSVSMSVDQAITRTESSGVPGSDANIAQIVEPPQCVSCFR